MALTIQFKNNATGTLSAGIVAADTTFILTAGHGAYFPTLAGGQYFYGTLKDSGGNLEIVKVTARSTDTLTVVRAQESTTAQATNAGGDTFELRPTAAGLNAIHTETLASAVASDGSTVMTGSLQLGATFGVVFEGTTADAHESTLVAGEPTADVTVTMPTTTTTLAGLAVAETFTAPQRGAITTDNDGSFDESVGNNFKCTPTATFALTFTNHTSGHVGNVILVNTGGYAVTAAATTKIATATLTAISTAGTYLLGYVDDGTNAYVTASGALV